MLLNTPHDPQLCSQCAEADYLAACKPFTPTKLEAYALGYSNFLRRLTPKQRARWDHAVALFEHRFGDQVRNDTH